MNIETPIELAKFCKVLFHFSFLQIPKVSLKLDSMSQKKKAIMEADSLAPDTKAFLNLQVDLLLGSKYAL